MKGTFKCNHLVYGNTTQEKIWVTAAREKILWFFSKPIREQNACCLSLCWHAANESACECKRESITVELSGIEWNENECQNQCCWVAILKKQCRETATDGKSKENKTYNTFLWNFQQNFIWFSAENHWKKFLDKIFAELSVGWHLM